MPCIFKTNSVNGRQGNQFQPTRSLTIEQLIMCASSVQKKTRSMSNRDCIDCSVFLNHTHTASMLLYSPPGPKLSTSPSTQPLV